MKLVPKVNTDGLYLEDELVDDAFSGVVPFYIHSSLTLSDTDQQLDTYQVTSGSSSATDEANSEPVPAGYTIGIPIPSGLYHPRFDIRGWLAYEAEYGEKLMQRDPTTFWGEGLSDEAIQELTQKTEQQPSEEDQLKQRIADLEVMLTQLMLGSTGK
ncbi:hypothetical protein HPL003_13745 [Paenibacillus terrae HPL-003]|uniref:Bacteriophage SP-beta YorD domain-containing protein n=1 Tax=Paenibacillus terrae (strain HPL-003) TaxID=985665 RepID=G7VYW0_PAETH|nr:hypothetical protein [Paenibacillus terrae]AET59500.1 hypothetical protein HPL003_13745 [Paenibacillus terrae HPL-003]